MKRYIYIYIYLCKNSSWIWSVLFFRQGWSVLFGAWWTVFFFRLSILYNWSKNTGMTGVQKVLSIESERQEIIIIYNPVVYDCETLKQFPHQEEKQKSLLKYSKIKNTISLVKLSARRWTRLISLPQTLLHCVWWKFAVTVVVFALQTHRVQTLYGIDRLVTCFFVFFCHKNFPIQLLSHSHI